MNTVDSWKLARRECAYFQLNGLHEEAIEEKHAIGQILKRVVEIFTVVLCILMPSKTFIYQLMHNRVALKEY